MLPWQSSCISLAESENTQHVRDRRCRAMKQYISDVVKQESSYDKRVRFGIVDSVYSAFAEGSCYLALHMQYALL